MKPPPRAFVSQVIVYSVLLLVFAGSLGLCAVWTRQGISGAANRSRGINVKIADIERRLDQVNAKVAAALNPKSLLQQNEAMKLGLTIPREIQVVRVEGAPELRLAAKRNREIFNVTSTTTSSAVATPSMLPVVAGNPSRPPTGAVRFPLVTASLR